MNNDHPVFVFLEQLIKAALTKQVQQEEAWQVTKAQFEDAWEAQKLHDDIEAVYCLQVADDEVELDFADQEDVGSLTNCYVTLQSTGELGALLEAHGVQLRLQIDVFNHTLGHDVAVLGEDDVVAQVALLRVWSDEHSSFDGLSEKLQDRFGVLAPTEN